MLRGLLAGIPGTLHEGHFAVVNAVVSSLQPKPGFIFLEPLGQLSGQMTPSVMENFGQFFVMMFLPMLLSNYPMGVAQAYLFRKYGFLASFTLRMGHYIVWHVVYGSMVYPLLNA